MNRCFCWQTPALFDPHTIFPFCLVVQAPVGIAFLLATGGLDSGSARTLAILKLWLFAVPLSAVHRVVSPVAL
jgi:hypothetical protein